MLLLFNGVMIIFPSYRSGRCDQVVHVQLQLDIYNVQELLWLYGRSIYDYLCNQCLSPLMLWVQILLKRCVLDTTLWNIVESGVKHYKLISLVFRRYARCSFEDYKRNRRKTKWTTFFLCFVFVYCVVCIK